MICDLLDLIGNTPLIKIDNLYLKLEYFNPSGSIKDRMAIKMIEDLEKRSILKENGYVIETSSGNTGISLAMICAMKKYKLIVIMYNDSTIERIKTLKAYGAKVYLINRDIDIEVLGRKLSNKLEIPFLDQHTNCNNYLAYKSLASEIISEINELDYCVCGIGTGGTIVGISYLLKEKYPNVKMIGVLPVDKKNCLLYGINSSIEEIKFDTNCIDELRYVSNEDALRTKNEFCKKGYFFGNSSGACLYIAKLLGESKKTLVIIPDNNFKYLSDY